MKKMMTLPRTLLLFAALATPALAQPPSPTPEPTPPRVKETVNVEAELPPLPPSSTAATRVPVAAQALPLSVSIVPRRLMADQAAFVLSDALRNASGVNAAVGFGVFDVFTIRGFDSLNSGLVLTDGVAEPESTFYPMYNVRQVEVLKGPSAFLHGANPLAGAVQIVHKQPGPGRFGSLSLTYGRFGTFETAVDGNAATRDGRLSFRLNAAWQGTESHRDLEGGAIAAVNPVVAWRPDDRTRVTLGLEYVKSDWPPDSGLPFVGESGSTLAPVDPAVSYQSPLDVSEQDVVRLRFVAERRIGRFTVRNRLYFTELQWDSDGSLMSGVFPFPDGRSYVIRTLVSLDDRQRLFGDQLELASSFHTGAVGHDLLFGVECSQLKDRFTQDAALIAPIDMLAPAELPIPPTPLPQFGLVGDARALVVAPYVVDRLSLSKRWQAFLGARLDNLNYDDDATATTRDDRQVSPMAGLVFSPRPAVALHVSGGTSFAPPSTQVAGPREPETSRQIEAGAKLQVLDGRVFLGATAYVLERRDIAIPDSVGIFTQAGDQRSRGLELDLSAEPAKGLITYASYAFTDAALTRFAELVLAPTGPLVLDRTGNVPPYAPRHLVNVWISKEFPFGLGLAGGIRGLSDQFVGEDNRYHIDGYVTADAAISWRFRKARFAVNLKNLTGTEYATRGFGGLSAIPARPFEVLGRVQVDFGSR